MLTVGEKKTTKHLYAVFRQRGECFKYLSTLRKYVIIRQNRINWGTVPFTQFKNFKFTLLGKLGECGEKTLSYLTQKITNYEDKVTFYYQKVKSHWIKTDNLWYTKASLFGINQASRGPEAQYLLMGRVLGFKPPRILCGVIEHVKCRLSKNYPLPWSLLSDFVRDLHI